MQSKATTVSAYLKELPPDRRAAMEAVRAVIRKHLPNGYEEGMQYGMIGYGVPLKRYPAGYLNNPNMPLPYAGLASQKQYLALYLMSVYSDAETARWFKAEYAKTGKKLDMGKSCLRFKKAEDLPLDLIGHVIARTSVEEWIKAYERSRKQKRK